MTYDCIDDGFPVNETGGDRAVCTGMVSDGNRTITGLFCSAKPADVKAGVFNGFQIIGPIPHLPQGTVFSLR